MIKSERMKKRSFLFMSVLSLLVPLCDTMSVPIRSEEESPEDEYSTTYWCPTSEIIARARAQHTRAENIYKVITIEEWDV